MKRCFGWLVLPLFLSLTARAEKTAVVPEVAAKLHAADPSAPWSSGWSEKADVTCHGQKDILVVAHDAHKVWLGVVRTAQYTTHAQTIVSQWPIAHGDQAAFCAVPTKLEVYPRSCQAEGGQVQDCRPILGCMAFTLPDFECGSFNFYWDDSGHRLRWWRRRPAGAIQNIRAIGE